ncbi:succinate dehydrogenase assembly factor 2 [Candidatus Pelagibacter sp.]|nr:succinate dehydrogenase assembly factor 2 [Candidatus Pelagibacter sp.]
MSNIIIFMTINIKDLKNKIIYRANYRGTKEMDKLLGSFTKKYIDQFNEQELKLLCDLLDYDDENLYKFNQGQNLTIQIKPNKVSVIFKNYKYVSE